MQTQRLIIGLLIAIAAADVSGRVAHAQPMNVGFEDINLLMPDGWSFTNNSNPLGDTNWFQGVTSPFSAQDGAATSYLAANLCNTGGPGCFGAGNISNWAILPTRTLSNGDTFSFWTRSSAAGSFGYDRMQVRMSLNGASGNVGTSDTGVGDFTTLLLDINPTYTMAGYPTAQWQQFNLVLSGIGAPTQGRLAFRYFVEGSGSAGLNGSYIGIDSLLYNPFPEPSTLCLMFAGGLALARRRR